MRQAEAMMRLFLLTSLVMVAFASNSLLNRAALVDGHMGPASFLALRFVAAAVTLIALVLWQERAWPQAGSWPAALALLTYGVFFSFAYLALDAGLGALMLFGMVQITLFGMALQGGERPGWPRWTGAALGLLGLALLFVPGAERPPLWALLAMGVAGVAWGVYTYLGRSGGPPLAATARNFALAAPFACLIWLISPAEAPMSPYGVVLAIASGAIASGLGYALWYTVLPRIDASLAAVSQLTVPVIAIFAGVLLLGEPVSWLLALSSVLVLGGVALAVLAGAGRK
ncbi:MAG: DMT family transporter [Pseudomonadota bacterium]